MTNRYQVTWERYRSWAVENIWKGRNLFLAVVWSALALVCVLLGIAYAMNSYGIMFPAVYFLFAVLCTYHAFFRVIVAAKAKYRKLGKLYGAENWTREIIFQEDGIRLVEGNIVIQIAYQDIVNLRDKDNKVWIDLANKTVMRMYKDTFVDGDWESCKRRICEKMAK